MSRVPQYILLLPNQVSPTSVLWEIGHAPAIRGIHVQQSLPKSTPWYLSVAMLHWTSNFAITLSSLPTVARSYLHPKRGDDRGDNCQRRAFRRKTLSKKQGQFTHAFQLGHVANADLVVPKP